jgi:hypothetical protein
MRSRAGVAFAVFRERSCDDPSGRRASGLVRTHLQRKHKHKRPAVGSAQHPTRPVQRSKFATARELFVSVRSNGVPALVTEARKIHRHQPERKRLWCPRFMNYVLAKLGCGSTNSDAAKSFAYYGTHIRAAGRRHRRAHAPEGVYA